MSVKEVKDPDEQPLHITEKQKDELFQARLYAASPTLFWLYHIGVIALTAAIMIGALLLLRSR